MLAMLAGSITYNKRALVVDKNFLLPDDRPPAQHTALLFFACA